MEAGSILITGASGFVGVHLVRALRERLPGMFIIGCGRSRESKSEYALDITNAQAVNEFIAAKKPDIIYHLASLAFVPDAEANPERAFGVNLMGTMNLAAAALRYVPNCRFMYISSSEVYGRSFNTTRTPLDESAILSPLNFYASSKAAADLLMGQYASRGLATLRLRPFNHIGPGQAERFVVANFVKQIVAAENGLQPPIIRVGNLETVRDFLDVRDVVGAYVLAALRGELLVPGEVLNIASGKPLTIGELLGSLLSRSRVSLKVVHDPCRGRSVEIGYSVGDASKARMKLGWRERYTLDQTFDEMLEASRSN